MSEQQERAAPLAPRIVEEPVASALPGYGSVPIAFVVTARLRVDLVEGGLGGIRLIEEPVEPYRKDYDSLAGEGPAHWSDHWDIRNWGILSAFEGARRIGGAAVAWRTAGLDMLQGRDDRAALWDLRVHPDWRGRGVGHRLFDRALAWARERGCRFMTVETQNTNVRACHFYARQGCVLGAIDRYAYGNAASDSEETQLLWYRVL